MSAPLRTNATVARSTPATAHAGVLQRKCKCGSTKSSTGPSCEECKGKPVQRKLSIGRSDDRFELEADRIAEQVLRDDRPAAANVPNISRLAIATPASGGDESAAPASVDGVLAGSGRPLAPELRQDMERRFGYDFGAVRIHTDASAERSAHEIGAAAYTVGHHVVFGAGRFSPATRVGRHLLAHELTHVVQQAAPARAGVNQTTARIMRQPVEKDGIQDPAEKFAPHLPEPVTKANKREERIWLLARENVQWHATNDAAADHFESGWGLDVVFSVFDPHDPKGRKYSALELANFAIDALLYHTGLVFRPGARKYLAEFIAWVIVANSYRLEGAKGEFLEVDGLAFFGVVFSANLLYAFSAERNFRSLFELESWNNWAAFIRANVTAKGGSLQRLLVASANYGDKFGGKAPKDKKKATDERPGWTMDQERALQKLVDEARKEKPRPELPDRLVFYPHKGAWFVNVWVHFDTAGKDAEHVALRLRQGEKPDDLYQRALRAVQQALEIRRGEDRKRLEAEMPKWAKDLHAKVKKALGDEKGRDIPDGMTLVLDARGANVRGPGKENVAQQESEDTRETQVLLRIWVFRGDKDNPANRKQGSVPIFPRTEADKLVSYVRNLAAVLREGEHIPDDAVFTASYQPGEQMLPNFEAMILPIDLGADKITVAGATNKFSMFLDFDKQYNAIGADAIYVASKLYNQPIYYDWKIFEAPQGAHLGKSSDDWGPRWVKLYDHFNPNSDVKEGGQIRATTRAGLVTEPSAGVDTGDDDITTRVDLPDTSGDYLVYCRTRHKAIGDAKLKRVSSVAYFPVRLRTRSELVTPQITAVSSAVTAVKANIADLQARLAEEAFHPGTLKPTEKAVLEESLKTAEAQKEMFFAQEHGDFVASADAQIKFNLARLPVAKRLKERLPKVLEQAKANAASGTGSTKATELLADAPDLLTLYLELREAKMTAATYEKELIRETEKLRKERDRAIGFQNKFKDKSDGGCVYAPEAVFLSKIDGRLYPLKLAVGEAKARSPEKVAYSVVDVTLPETSKSYRGFSLDSGEGGHREAIERAFETFGDEGMYGTGWIAVRMPVGGPENECATYRPSGGEIVYYDSEKGILDRVLQILGLLAAFIGVIALTLTGVGMAGAGALLGVLAASMGAASAFHNMSNRADRNTLKFDAELVGDILAIVGLGEAILAARLVTLPQALRGVQAYQRMGKFLALLQLGTGTAAILLIPIQTLEDINRIKALGLPPDVEREMIRQAIGNAVVSAVMATSMLAMSRIQNRMRQTGMPVEEEHAALREQAELLALEDPKPPPSLREKGWVDADGNWTDLAPAPIRERAQALARGASADAAHPTQVTEKIPDAAQKGVDKVNRGEARIEGKTPGKRRADLGDNHEIAEKQEPNGSVSCWYRSPIGIHVDCPGVLGKPTPGNGEPAKPEARTGTKPDDAPRKRPDEPTDAPAPDDVRTKPRDVKAPPPKPVDADGADPNTALRQELTDELAALRKKVAANDQIIRDNKQNIADKQAAVNKASNEFTSAPHDASLNDAAKQKRADAARNLKRAERELRDANAISNVAKNANDGHYRRMLEIKEFFNPTPKTNEAKGTFAEEQGDIAIREGKTEPMPGATEKFEGNWKWRGSSQDPHDPAKTKPQGLDGGYENLDQQQGSRHLAAEFKHDDAPMGKGQETHKWVDDRLDDALGFRQAERMRAEGYEYWVFRYRPGTKTVERKFMWQWVATGKKNSRGQWEGSITYRQRR